MTGALLNQSAVLVGTGRWYTDNKWIVIAHGTELAQTISLPITNHANIYALVLSVNCPRRIESVVMYQVHVAVIQHTYSSNVLNFASPVSSRSSHIEPTTGSLWRGSAPQLRQEVLAAYSFDVLSLCRVRIILHYKEKWYNQVISSPHLLFGNLSI